jgi:hypothetical protein
MTITQIKKELIKEINRTRNNLSSCVCKQGYKDLISFVRKLGTKKRYKKTTTINGLDVLKAMENAKTPLNPFVRHFYKSK